MLEMGMIVNECVDEAKIAYYHFNKVVYNSDLLDITIIPTMACNFACKYCFQDNHVGIMSKETVEKMQRFLYKSCYKYKKISIEWFGGEPLIASTIVLETMKSLNKAATSSNAQIISSMTTNGYLLNAELMADLCNNGIRYFQIFLDGDQETHNKMRPHRTHSDSFEKIYDNLLKIHKLPHSYHFSIGLRINVSPANIESVKSLLRRIQQDFQSDGRFSVLLQWVRDWGGEQIKKNAELISSVDLCSQFYEFCIENHIPCVDYLTCHSGLAYCGARKLNSFVIFQDGNLYKCGMIIGDKQFDEINQIGQIDKHGNAAIDEQKNAEWVVQEKLESGCTDCFYFPLCMGGPCRFATKINKQIMCHDGKKQYEYLLRNLDSVGQLLKID